MNAQQLGRLRALLSEQRVLTLGVVVGGEPVTGLLPYALESAGPALLVHVSALARHADGLAAGARFAALIQRPDDGVVDAMQIERANLQGAVERVEAGSKEHAAARATYLRRFPGAAMTFSLGDFTLIRLRPDRGRLVTGVGGAVNLNARNLDELSAALVAGAASAQRDDADGGID